MLEWVFVEPMVPKEEHRDEAKEKDRAGEVDNINKSGQLEGG